MGAAPLDTIADVLTAIDKAIAPTGLHVVSSTWRHVPDRPAVVTIKLESGVDSQLVLLFGTED